MNLLKRYIAWIDEDMGDAPYLAFKSQIAAFSPLLIFGMPIAFVASRHVRGIALVCAVAATLPLLAVWVWRLFVAIHRFVIADQRRIKRLKYDRKRADARRVAKSAPPPP